MARRNPAAPPRKESKPSRPKVSVLEDLPLYLSRVYYSFLGLVERELVETGLNEHLKPGMGHILLALYEEDDCIIKSIAERTRIAHGTLTGLLDRMEKGRIITRNRCKADGRAFRIQLTPLGKALEPRLREFHERMVQTVHKGLSAEELTVARRALDQMLENFREMETKHLARADRQASKKLG